MAEGTGQFTVKEILTEIVIPELKAIKTSVEQKADRTEVLALESRMAHFEAAESSYVKRTGPVIDEIRDHDHRIASVEKDNIRRDAIAERFFSVEKQVGINTGAINGLPLAIRMAIETALKDYDTSAKTLADRTFSRRDRILLAILSVIGAVATIVSTIYLVLATGTGGHG